MSEPVNEVENVEDTEIVEYIHIVLLPYMGTGLLVRVLYQICYYKSGLLQVEISLI